MKTILVTGASRGIGRGIAIELSRAGLRVAIHYNGNRQAAIEAATLCRAAYPPDAQKQAGVPEDDIFQANIGVSDDRDRLVTEVINRFGSLDGLVNNAGIAPRKRDDIIYSDEEVFDEVMQVNLYGPYFLTQRVARYWLENTADHPRHVVFVTSVSAQMASTQRGEYCVSKAGLAMTAQLFAARLAGDGILVYEIRPGIIATDMTSGVKEKYDTLIAEGLVPQRRWGEPRDIGASVRAIMEGALDFSPGTVLHSDGGLHLSRL